MKTEFDALLFDMDGTLVDSTALVERTWMAFAKRQRVDFEELIAFAHGRPTAETVAHFVGDTDMARDETARITATESADVEGIVEVPGAAALIELIGGQPWAIVTSAGRDVALARLEAAGIPLPDVLVTPENIAKGKPSPEGYLAAAKALGVDIERCVVFEDAGPGIAAGVSAGASVVVVGEYSGRESHGLPRVPDLTSIALSPGQLHFADGSAEDLVGSTAGAK